jgi:hypothetical protein
MTYFQVNKSITLAHLQVTLEHLLVPKGNLAFLSSHPILSSPQPLATTAQLSKYGFTRSGYFL